MMNPWLNTAIHTLEDAGIPSARLDALVLLEDFTGKDRSWLLAHPEFEPEDTKTLNEQIERRAHHEPLAYIRGKSEFYGREFKVSADTLEPRSETESIIDLLKTLNLQNSPLIKDGPLYMVDAGTGSGCLAITAKLEFPEIEVFGTDVSEAALKIAHMNNQALNAGVQFLHGSLLEPLIEQNIAPDIIITNLPYVPNAHTINQAAMFEPCLAIFGGEDGLDLYRQLFAQLKDLARHPAYILTESLPFQHPALTQIAEAAGYALKTSQDFIQVFTRN